MRIRHEKAPGNGRFFIPFLEAFLFAVFLFGCSSAEPEIMQTDLRVVATWDPNAEKITEELFLLADIFDSDGIEDVGELRIAHDGEKLQWRRSADAALRRSRSGQEWFGFSAASVDGANRIPRGTYRVEVDDLSGRAAVRRVAVPLSVPATGPGDVPAVDASEIVIPVGADEITVVHVPDDGPVQFYQIATDVSETTRMPVNALPEPVRSIVSPGADSSAGGEVWLIHEVNNNLVRRSGPWR